MTTNKKLMLLIPIFILLCIVGLRSIPNSSKNIESTEDSELYIISKDGD